MSVFRTTQSFGVLVLAALLCVAHVIPTWAENTVTGWQFAALVRDFEEPPDEQHYRVSVDTRKMDTSGAELVVRLVPRRAPGCSQAYLIGWMFDRDVRVVREGELYGVQLSNEPYGGISACFLEAEAASHDRVVQPVLAFKASATSTFPYEDKYERYVTGSALSPFSKTTDTRFVVSGEARPPDRSRSGLDGFVVQDSVHRGKPGEMDAASGAVSFEVSMSGVFKFVATYFYDALAAPVDALGRQWKETESGWHGVWVRRGNSNVFDAHWGSGPGAIRAVLIMDLDGNTVTIRRRGSTDRNDCDYTGTIAADGVTVNGSYSCSREGTLSLLAAPSAVPKPWHARIER